MLIEFSVTNYRSINECQTLSLVASEDVDRFWESHTFAAPNSKDLHLLKSTTIYGPNASGKSNLVRALKTFQNIVINSASRMQEGDEFDVQFFVLEYEMKPTLHILYSSSITELKIIFIQNKIRYEYGVILYKTHVIEEWLIAYPKQRVQTWFTRKHNIDNKDLRPRDRGYEWSFPSLKGEKQRIKNLVRPNSLFLSHAAQNNHPQLLEVFNWFKTNLNVITTLESKDNHRAYTANKCMSDPNFHSKIFKLLNQSNNEIDHINFEDGKIVFAHKTYEKGTSTHNIPQSLLIDDESDGTQRLFELGGVWIEALQEGKVIVIDELERSLHPTLARSLVEMFHTPETNPHHAQLIFTTHDTTLLDRDLFRQDQIWFTEKKRQKTHLYSLLEFRPREDESLQRGYLLGRYGAIPFVGGLKI
ncbi:ATP-binding protein [Roseofilum reptotaenium CS-1145]|uniref:ATPase AAA-type core domain-containing protein n=1 Tax=Roseofilum reptotaenium AO1-A TaxID=1925591 RepID=A0A1L9QRZ6_9CYAN|nr:ATP-binding protein [Roseofilum reptotaenium]MDB9515862.1 ATP-binding protein [Roseofilum reptotaenium CS-1145]OJJ25429.1 hypothetical protein BI308_11595 [Roseofilum reptotaenium AO1-A]